MAYEEEIDTKNAPPPIDKRITNVTAFKATSEESRKLAFILGRFDKMRAKRQGISKFWQIYQTQYESKYFPYSDGRSRSNIPLEWAIIELFVAETIQRKSEITIDPVGETDMDKVEILKRVKDYDWDKYSRDAEIYRSEYSTAIYGSSIYYVGYNENGRIIRDPNEDGTYTNKILKNNCIELKNIDIRNFYIDDRVNNAKDANDQIFIQYIPEEELATLKYDKMYKNLESVGTSHKREQDFFTWEEKGFINAGLVELMHYFNKNSDEYIVIANRSVIIREQPLPYSHKKLPFTIRQYAYTPFSVYGRGLCEALTNFKSQINTLKEMILDGIKRSNNSIFAIGGGLQFDGSSFAFDNNIRKFQGQLNDNNFREIKGQQPNAAIFNYTEQLLKDVAIFTGIDPMAIVGSPSSTAFETAVKQESSLKRINVVLANRDIALQDVYTQYLQLLMEFFPVKKAEEVLEIGQTSTNESPTLLLKDLKPVYSKKGATLVEAKGRFPLQVKPEYIRGQVDVRVQTNFSKPTLKQLERDSKAQFIQNTAQLLQLITAMPSLADTIKPEDFIKDMALSYNIDLEAIGGINGGIAKEKKKLMDMVQKLAMTAQGGMGEPQGGLPGGMPGVAPVPPSTPPGGNQSVIPNVQASPAGGLVKQPETPQINNPALAAIAGR